MPVNKQRGNQMPIVVYGDSEAEATNLYTSVASSDGVVSLTDSDGNSLLTHESLSESMYNPLSGQIDLDEDVDMTAEASANAQRQGIVNVFSAECSDGCGKHIISEVELSFCPACASELPEDEESSDEDDVDLVDVEDEEIEDFDDMDAMEDDEYSEEEEEMTVESSESMIVVAGDTLAQAITSFREVATQRNSKVFASESGNFVSHSNSEVNYDPVTADFAEEVEGDVTIVSESSASADEIEAEHLVCSGCAAHHISTSSAIVSCIRCGEGLVESNSSDEEDTDEIDNEIASLSAEIDELEEELGLDDEEDMEDMDDSDLEDEEDFESESSEDDDIDLDSLLAEANDVMDEFEDLEFESESSDDLDEELEDFDPEAEEDLDTDDIMESESFADGEEFGSCSADDEDDIDLDALDEELNALESDDLESESADVELEDDILALLSESGDEEESDDEDEEMDDDLDIGDDEFEDAEDDDTDIEGLDIEDSLEDDEEEMASESFDEIQVDLLKALSASEDLTADKFHVAHCGQIDGQSTWTAFYGKLPVAMCSESNVRDVDALRNIFESPRFGEAVKAHASAEGIEDALSQFKFERIDPQIDVDAVVEQELISKCESRVQEAQDALQVALASVEEEKAADTEQRLDRVFDALAACTLGINRGVFQNVSNPVAVRLIAALSAAGISPANAESLVSDAFVEGGELYAEQLLGQARNLLEKPAEVQEAVIEQIVATASNRGAVVPKTVVAQAAPVVALQSESSDSKTQNSFLAILKK